jgi:hypothetical protein
MYVRGIDFTSVSTIYRMDFELFRQSGICFHFIIKTVILGPIQQRT